MRHWIPTALLLLANPAFAGTDPASPPGAAQEIAAPLIAQAWPLRFATLAEQQAWFDTSKGWSNLLVDRNIALATQQFGENGGLATARGHAEAAALYRQAALVAANSYIQAYGATPAPRDPVGVAHLLAVSYAITGDRERARSNSKLLDEVADPSLPWHAPWKTWLDSNAVWPPDLSKSFPLPAPTPGAWPELPPDPHYQLPEKLTSDALIDIHDPGALIALALWHESTARSLAGANAPWIDTYLARYRFPAEGPAAGVPLPDELLFASDFATAEDAAFLAAVLGPSGIGAVDTYADRSLLAAVAQQSRVDGKLDPDLALERANAAKEQLLAALAAKNGGTQESAHEMFAAVVQVGLLRNLAILTEREGNREGSGILRGYALARSLEATNCPNALLSLAAWDTQDRYPKRGTEILAGLVGRYPALVGAQAAHERFALRVAETTPTKVETPPPADDGDLVDDEIVVISDRFARWDGTRWFIKTEIGHPLGMTFYAEDNYEMKTNAFQIRTILACEKDFKLSRKLYEVSCTIEDFGIQAASRDQYGEAIQQFTKSVEEMSEKERKREEKRKKREAEGKSKASISLDGLTPEKRREHVEAILDEIDANLTGKKLQLQVRDDGRVTNIDLEGLSKDNARESLMTETLRMVMSRVAVGFDMRLNKWLELKEGVWTEYTSALMSMPLATRTTQGTSVLLHRLSKMQGHLVVESVGKGVINLTLEDNNSTQLNWMTTLNGVSVYDSHDGYMTERVWALSGKASASSWGMTDYWHAGRIVQLKPEQKPNCGESQLVTPPGFTDPQIPAWTPLEE